MSKFEQRLRRIRTRPVRATLSSSDRGWRIGGAIVAGLGAAVLVNRFVAKRAEAASPPIGKFVTIDGVKLHYLERGEGPPVVLLHGNGVMLQDYLASGVFDAIARHHRVIAFDRPGFGYSERPRTTIWTPAAQASLIAKAMAALDAPRAVVVGHSWGTLAALAMALDRPDAVAGLVLISGYYYPTARPDVTIFSLPAIPGVGDVMANTISPPTGALLAPVTIKASFSPAPVSPRFAEIPAGLMLRPSQVRATAADTALMVPGAAALSARYGELHVPIVVIAGAGDLIAHADRHARPFADAVAGVELDVIPGQGHLVHYAVPFAVGEAVTRVWARSGSAS